MKTTKTIVASAVLAASGMLASSALAVPMTVTHLDLSSCDPLFVPVDVHELGVGTAAAPFPPDEHISSSSGTVAFSACPAHDDPNFPNYAIAITNLSGIDWSDLWYVADPETKFTNVDGLVNGNLAFKIDMVGVNRPLLSESIVTDGIFQNGETWRFVVDSYTNSLGLPPDAFHSIGVGSFSGGDSISSASIIAVAVPEPSGLSVLVAGGLGMLRRRRSSATI